MIDRINSLCVIPLKYRSKEPEMKWEQYQRERPSREQVGAWFSDGKDHNIGIVTGQVSGGLVVLVFNREGDFEKFFKGIDILSMTPVAMSLRGQHVYLHVTGKVDSRLYANGRFEVKGEGTYVVAPPSIHPSGIQYRWLNPDVKEILHVADFNAWLRKKALRISIDTIEPQRHKDKPEYTGFFRIAPEKLRPRWAEKALEGNVPVMERNATCFKLACYLFKHYPKQEVIEIICRWAREKCEQPEANPFPEKEVRTTVESAYSTIIRRTKC